MNDKYLILTEFKGYKSRSDMTSTDERYLVSGSQNMLLNEFEKWESRNGYSIFGATNTARNRPKSEYTWFDNIGNEIFLREANGTLEFYSTVSSAWETLLTTLSATYPLRFTEIWSTTELIDELLFVNHSSTLYEWSGAMGTFASATSNTITINQTIAEKKFLSAGTREIRLKTNGGSWVTYVYTNQSGSTFTGVTPDPTLQTISAGNLVIQEVRATTTTPASGFVNDVISSVENQVYVGSHSSRRIYISKSTSFIDYTFSTPRIPTEGALLTMDDTTTGFKVGVTNESKDAMIIFSGKDRIYRTEFIFSPGSVADRETVKVKSIITAKNQGAKSQELIERTKNALVFVNNDNELVDLSSIENISTLQQNAISDDIRPDFLDADFTNGSLKFWRNSFYVTAPVTGKTFICTLRVSPDANTRKFWQTPQILPFGLLSIYGGDLYGHSSSITETYLAFDGVNDNGGSIAFKAHFAYRNGGEREKLKNFNKYFSELYLSSNAVVTQRILFEYKGARGIQEFTHRGDDTTYLFIPNISASLGVNPLGTNPLGATTSTLDELNKYRRFKKIIPSNHFEYQVQYELDEVDSRFQIMAHGPNMSEATFAPVSLTG